LIYNYISFPLIHKEKVSVLLASDQEVLSLQSMKK